MASDQALPVTITITLAGALAERLAAHGKAWKERAADTIADALTLHLDELDGHAPELVEPADPVDERGAPLVEAADPLVDVTQLHLPLGNVAGASS